MGSISQAASHWDVINSVSCPPIHSETTGPGDEVVCFGSVSGITGESELARGSFSPEQESGLVPIPARLDSCREFTLMSRTHSKGTISTQHVEMLQAILEEPAILVQISCTLNGDNRKNPKRMRSASRIMPCSLNMILYGPLSLSEELGEFFQSHDTFLQDPRHCAWDVKYCNPHRLSSVDYTSLPLTSQVNCMMGAAGMGTLELMPERAELLAVLNTEDDLPEAPQPDAIKTSLERHQKQALTFMLRREQGWDFGSGRDIWIQTRGAQGHFFVNLISGSHQSGEPPEFSGGIIADPMGLGKTLTMIALIATDLQRDNLVNNETADDEISEANTSNATLIVVPPPLVDTWEEQLAYHVSQGQLTWRRHHGKSRLVNPLETHSANIVVTTYHTVSAEWKKGSRAAQSILFSTCWKRVILDEAHFIRNTGSRMTKAICDLPSHARWAVTGTPIQNKLADLAALLKFLRVHPYGDTRRFDADITHLWKSRQAEEAVHRLKMLSRCLLLRRPKGTINLPSRTDLRCPVQFTPDERALYEHVKEQTIATMREAAYGEVKHGAPPLANVIQKINQMRIICNLGLHYSSRHEDNVTYNPPSPQTTQWERVAQATFNLQYETTTLSCEFCGSPTHMTDSLLEDVGATSKALFSQCLRFFCSDCAQSTHGGLGNVRCGHEPPHQMSAVSLDRSTLEEDAIQAHSARTNAPSHVALPSKVMALVRDLCFQSSDVKSIVFSTWRTTLDVVEQGLKQAQIEHLRFDGTIPQKERKGILDRFRTDSAVKVLLLTLTCGAVGLTLTEASRAYLMEPHWNPTMEEQALARVHRLGQKKEVTTVRFYIRDTFEERVMELQKKKEDLAGLLLDSQRGNAEQLERLCGLL
ncbi:SNF2 family N-terminal domain-containing protein [Xylaria palmicola]|nr:SNF2 family N-terminal domain-containing protein [Xylaria palmicola]